MPAHSKLPIIFLIFCVAAAANFSAVGQRSEPLPQFTVRQFTGEDGLADNKLAHFFQHPNGFCWAATANELMRFDGYRFSTFARNLPPVAALTANRKGEILLLHEGKYLNYTLLNPENKRSRRVEFNSERDIRDSIVAVGLQDSLVWAAAQSPTGVWLYRVGSNDKPRQIDFLEGEKFVAAGQRQRGIRQIALEKTGEFLYFSHDQHGLVRRRISKGEQQIFNKYFDGKNWQKLPAAAPQIFLENGQIPLLSFSNSPILLYFDEKLEQLRLISNFPGGKSASILAADEWGNLVVKNSVADLKNAWLWRNIEQVWVNLSPVLGKYSLKNVAGRDFDRQITAVTLEGLVQVNFYRPMFAQLLPADSRFRAEGIFETRGIATSPRTGQVAVMSEKFGVFLENRKTGLLEHLPLVVAGSNKKFLPTPGTAIAFDRAGFLWIPCVRPDSNFAKIDLATRQARVFEVPGKMFVRAMTAARDGKFWLATSNEFDSAIFTFDPATEQFSMLASGGTHPDLKSNTPFFILENREGKFWLGGTRGLRLFNPATNLFEKFAGQNSNPAFLKNEILTVPTIAEGADGQLFVGTLGEGLQILDTKTGAWQSLGTEQGLAGNDKIAGVLPDFASGKGNAWVSTYDGLSFLYRKNGGSGGASFLNFSKKEGLTHDEFNRFSYHESPDGRMFFGGLFGVNVFAPRDILANFDLANAPVLLSQYARLVSDDGKPVEVDTGLGRLDSIVFPPSERAFSFRFALANYWNPEKNRFRYRIEGLEHDDVWHTMADNSREITINYLPAGEYRLRVQGASAYGVWSEEERVINIRVEEHWWKTDWAFFGYALVVMGAILLFNRHQRNRRLQQLQLAQKERELEKEQLHARHLEKMNEAFGRFVPHDFLKRLGYKSVLDTRLGDQIKTRMTILFADIRDWTTLSEKMEPAENFNFINAYLNRVGPVIRANNGFVNQYFGDGIMALFPERASDALRAAVEMQQAIQNLNSENAGDDEHFPKIRVGIGLHTGSLMLGVLGDQNRFDTGVISDAVNTAARLESLTKFFGTNVLASEATLSEQLEDEPLATRFLGKIQVKGKQEPLRIFEILEGDSPDVLERKLAAAPVFEQGLQLYFDRQFEDAAAQFEQVLRLHPEDAVARFYVRRCQKFLENAPDLDWSGVEMMERK